MKKQYGNTYKHFSTISEHLAKRRERIYYGLKDDEENEEVNPNEQEENNLINDIVNYYIKHYQKSFIDYKSKFSHDTISLFNKTIDIRNKGVYKEFVYDDISKKFMISFKNQYTYKNPYIATLEAYKFYQSNINHAIKYSYRDLKSRKSISYKNFMNIGLLTSIEVVLEPDNKYSKYALAVYSHHFKIGYIKMNDNKELFDFFKIINSKENSEIINNAYFIDMNDLKEISFEIKEVNYTEQVFSEVLEDKIQQKFKKIIEYETSNMQNLNISEEQVEKRVIDLVSGRNLFNEYNTINKIRLHDRL